MNDMKQITHLAPDVLTGQKVYLRPPRYDELSFIRTLWADPETMTAVGGPIDFPESKAKEWFSRMVSPGDSTNFYCLIFNQEHIPVGEISFHRWKSNECSAELNVKVLASHRGCGYAKDALITFLGCFFGRIGGCIMTDDVALNNLSGQHLLLSIGFNRDDSVQNVYKMIMTKQMYVKQYGEAQPFS